MGTAEMEVLAEILADLIGGGDPATHRARIAELCAAFPLPG
jgi:hypothetical protein